MPVTKAIIPAAGFGTRMLPLTMAVPKELLPVAGKPVIQYVVEEAVNSGIHDILIVISRGKESIRRFFEKDLKLEQALLEKGMQKELEAIQYINSLANIEFVEQKEMKGLGDAIYCGNSFVGTDSFAVLLGDNIIKSNSDTPVLKNLIQKHLTYQSSIIGIQQVDSAIVHRYGILDGYPSEEENLYRATGWVEKPKPLKAPSCLAVAGVYTFTPDIFNALEHTSKDGNNEVQITDAMDILSKSQPTYGYVYDGTRYDIGNVEDYIRTNLLFSKQF